MCLMVYMRYLANTWWTKYESFALTLESNSRKLVINPEKYFGIVLTKLEPFTSHQGKCRALS